MSKNTMRLALPVIVGAIAFAQAASATVVSYAYSGRVDYGVDQIGLFGDAGGNLSGLDFTAVFLRDDALADDVFLGDINSYVRGAQAVTAKLTINNITVDVGGRRGEQTQYDDGEFEGFRHFAAGLLGSLDLSATTLGTFAPGGFDYLPGPDYHTLPSLSADLARGLSFSGRFDFGAADPNVPERDVFTMGRFTPLRLVVTPDPGGAAVPEPAAWAMMILGFGGVGAALRRRDRPVAA